MDLIHLPERYDLLAPDGSEIRLLSAAKAGSMVHCTLPPGAVSKAVRHRTVEEIWFFLQGRGQVWRRRGDEETTVEVGPGVSLTIETGDHFQFRNSGIEDLCFIIATMPPWPGEHEAVRVGDHWEVGGAA